MEKKVRPTISELSKHITYLENQISYQESIIAKQANILSKDECLQKLKVDEPVFTLRAQDRLAPMLIRLWADLTATQSNRQAKAENAYHIAQTFDDWARINKSQFPD